MVGVYRDFIMIEGSNKIANHTNTLFNQSTNTTSIKDSTSLNSNTNSNKKDGKKPRNDKSSSNNNQSSSLKDSKKDKDKKKKYKREDDVIQCKIHNTLGNHYTRNCPLQKGGASTNTVY